MDRENLSQTLLKIIAKAANNRIYGSIEIYFEDGKITQVTQRVISKIKHKTNNHDKENNSVTLTGPVEIL